MQERGADVVAVARPDHLATPDRPAMLLEGHHVGHDLAGMAGVRQTVDHRHRGVFRQFGERRLLEGPDHDQVDIAREHAGGVGDGLAVAELHLAAREHQRLAAHLPDADIEAHPGPGRGFLEDQGDHAAGQRLVRIRGAARGAAARRLHLAGPIEDRAQIIRGNDTEVEEVLHDPAFSAAAAVSSRRSPSSASSSVSVRGGSSRSTFSAPGTVRTLTP